MEHNNYQWFITQTVEAMLPRFSDRNIVLCMKIDASWTDHGFADDGNTRIRKPSTFRKTVFLVFHRPHNYTKVLMAEIPQDPKEKVYRLLPCTSTVRMEQLCDHDSCWTTMDWIFNSFQEAWSFFEDQGLETAETRKIDPSFHYSIFRGKPQYWLIKKLERTDPDDRYGSDYMIEFDRQIHLDEISKFMVNAQQ